MDIRRETDKNEDGTTTVHTSVTLTPDERRRVGEIFACLNDLGGITKVGGTEVFDNTAMLVMTDLRKRIFVDAADLIEKIVYGDD